MKKYWILFIVSIFLFISFIMMNSSKNMNYKTINKNIGKNLLVRVGNDISQIQKIIFSYENKIETTNKNNELNKNKVLLELNNMIFDIKKFNRKVKELFLLDKDNNLITSIPGIENMTIHNIESKQRNTNLVLNENKLFFIRIITISDDYAYLKYKLILLLDLSKYNINLNKTDFLLESYMNWFIINSKENNSLNSILYENSINKYIENKSRKNKLVSIRINNKYNLYTYKIENNILLCFLDKHSKKNYDGLFYLFYVISIALLIFSMFLLTINFYVVRRENKLSSLNNELIKDIFKL